MKKTKNNCFRFCACVFLFFLSANLSFSISAAEVQVKAYVDNNKVYIGDTVKYILECKPARALEVEFPEAGDKLGDFSVREQSLKRKGFQKQYHLVSYKPGVFTIPALSVRYRFNNNSEWQDIQTDKVIVEVASILGEAGDISDIRDIKGPFIASTGMSWPLIIVLMMIAVAAAAYFIFQNRHRALPKDEVVKSAHEIAYEALEELKRRDYLKLGKIKEFYAELSFIIRVYLENRFNLRAPEMTTEEFLNTLRQNDFLSGKYKNLLKEFLSHCDLVKFAKYGPSTEETAKTFDSAIKFVDQTKIENKPGKYDI
ncbi:MAG: hypothetical protein PHU64_05300 [Candidatus Omnitrophica bacterium]|nr:hypothetical protein [Candidatus Omnitrophota bacterium]MDD5430148.1 hypothetical protein [Candidatus Omnitrophota bacterium]